MQRVAHRTRPVGLTLVAAVAAALAVSACGTAAPATLARLKAKATSSTIVPVTTGAGTEHLGDVNLNGHIAAQLTCSGHGSATLQSPAAVSFAATCSPSGTSMISAVGTDVAVHAQHVEVTVVAGAHVRWRLTIYLVS